MTRESESGLPIEPVYGPEALRGCDPAERLGEPGELPVHPRRLSLDVHRPPVDDAPVRRLRHRRRVQRPLPPADRRRHRRASPWPSTCRPRWATTPTTPLAHGEVGKVGVAIDSIDDMRTLFDGIPLDKVSTSMTINAPGRAAAAALPAGRRGAGRRPAAELTGTIQNDVLKEYIARGTYIYPPKPSLRLIADIFAYCRAEIPQLEHHLDLRLPHGRGRGHARAGDRVHPRQRHRVRPRRARGRARRRRLRARGCRSSSSPARRCSRRSRSSAPPGGSGRG